MINATIKSTRYKVDAKAKESQMRIDVYLFEKVDVINIDSKSFGSVALRSMLKI